MTNRTGPLPWYRRVSTLVAAAASTGAATVSVLTFLYSFGIVGDSASRNAVGSIGVAWIGVQPAADTARAIGDTLRLAATIADRAGTTLLNARPTWTSDDPRVATVGQDGLVVARRAGRTQVTVALGSVTARAAIVVQPRVTSASVGVEDGAGALVIGEGERRVMLARGRDQRGHDIAGVAAAWRIADSTVAQVDSAGMLVGTLAGRTEVVATVAGVEARAEVRVVPMPGAMRVVAGDGQRAPTAATLPVDIAVQVLSRGGVPMRGIAIEFRVGDTGGRVEEPAVLTDSDGRARTRWSLGSIPGRQVLLVSAGRLDSVVAIGAEADPRGADTRVALLGDSIAGVAGATLDAPVAVAVSDTLGRLLRDVPVRWLAADGTVEPLGERTDSLGVVRARWTLGPRARPQRMVVQVGAGRGETAVPPLHIVASARPGPAARVVVVRGDAQRGVAGAALARPIVVRVVDALGNPVPGASLMVAGRAGKAGDTTVVADSAGSASLAWTLGAVPGTQTLRIGAVGSASALVPVTATARAPARTPAASPAVKQAGRPRTVPPRRKSG